MEASEEVLWVGSVGRVPWSGSRSQSRNQGRVEVAGWKWLGGGSEWKGSGGEWKGAGRGRMEAGWVGGEQDEGQMRDG